LSSRALRDLLNTTLILPPRLLHERRGVKGCKTMKTIVTLLKGEALTVAIRPPSGIADALRAATDPTEINALLRAALEHALLSLTPSERPTITPELGEAIRKNPQTYGVGACCKAAEVKDALGIPRGCLVATIDGVSYMSGTREALEAAGVYVIWDGSETCSLVSQLALLYRRAGLSRLQTLSYL